MSRLRDQLVREHIDRHYPNAHILHYDDPDSDLTFYSAEELATVDEDWFPLCSHKDKESGRLLYGGRKKVVHTYTEGETGAGKTTRFVIQSIRALSCMKSKPSFLITDIHGEIIENLYLHLKEQGYNIRILNCDDPDRSDTYNPLATMAEECLKTRTISHETINQIRRMAELMQPVESTRDPIWEQGARAYTNGSILDKFEDLINGDIAKECLNLYNVIQNHYHLRKSLEEGFSSSNLFRIDHYKKKGADALSTQKMIAVTNNAERTRASYYGVVENHYDMFGQPSLYALSSNSTIDVADIVNTPTAIVIQSGSTKIGDDLISLLANDIYTTVVKLGKASKTKKLPRSIHCFLDEFANCHIADGPDFIKMLTTSRKFGLYWHMILQCDAQLDRKYDAYIGRIIRANCTELFMGTNDYETAYRFARSCGRKTVESLASRITEQGPYFETVDIIDPEQLNLTKEGYVYIKSERHPLTMTYMEAFFNCDEFVPVEDLDEIYPHNTFDYRQTAFYFDDIPPSLPREACSLLVTIGETTPSLADLILRFPTYDIQKCLDALTKDHLIAYNREGDLTLTDEVTPSKLSLYRHRLAHDIGMRPSDEPNAAKVPRAEESAVRPAAPPTDSASSESDPSPLMKRSPLYDALELHFHSHSDRSTDVLDTSTCIPHIIAHVTRNLAQNQQSHPVFLARFPANPTVLKIEIIETFIRNHNFSTKKEWVETLKKECAEIEKSNILPPVIMTAFQNAQEDLQKKFTLPQLKDLKKKISQKS